MFEILRTRTTTYMYVTWKAHPFRYIYIYVRTIGCENDLIASRGSRRGMSGNPRCIRETTPEDRSRSHPWRRHRRARGRSRRNCGSKFRARRKWMICFEHVSEALRHGDVIMDAVERQSDREREIDRKGDIAFRSLSLLSAFN